MENIFIKLMTEADEGISLALILKEVKKEDREMMPLKLELKDQTMLNQIRTRSASSNCVPIAD